MFKGRAGSIIHIGLSRANIERLKTNDPILFDLRDLGLKSPPICVSCQMGGRAAFPTGFTGIGIALSAELLDRLMAGAAVHQVQLDAVKLLFFAGETEQSMERMLRQQGLITHETVGRHKGFPPGSFVSDN